MSTLSSVLPSVSTGAGDTGTSTLCSDVRIRKDAPIFSFMGMIDELSCYLGICCLNATSEVVSRIRLIQNYLSESLGCVACGIVPSVDLSQFTLKLETWTCDSSKIVSNGKLFGDERKNSFGKAATVCRKAEELLIGAAIEGKTIHQLIFHLSKYLSVLAGECDQIKNIDVSFKL
jgi:cob(I)alamin adenosyltransferase